MGLATRERARHACVPAQYAPGVCPPVYGFGNGNGGCGLGSVAARRVSSPNPRQTQSPLPRPRPLTVTDRPLAKETALPPRYSKFSGF